MKQAVRRVFKRLFGHSSLKKDNHRPILKVVFIYHYNYSVKLIQKFEFT